MYLFHDPASSTVIWKNQLAAGLAHHPVNSRFSPIKTDMIFGTLEGVFLKDEINEAPHFLANTGVPVCSCAIYFTTNSRSQRFNKIYDSSSGVSVDEHASASGSH